MDIQKYISSGIIESYVMGLCNEAEEKELETLRTQYPELNSAILSFESEMGKQLSGKAHYRMRLLIIKY